MNEPTALDELYELLEEELGNLELDTDLGRWEEAEQTKIRIRKIHDDIFAIVDAK